MSPLFQNQLVMPGLVQNIDKFQKFEEKLIFQFKILTLSFIYIYIYICMYVYVVASIAFEAKSLNI